MSAWSSKRAGACAAHALLQQLAEEIDRVHDRNQALVAEQARLEKIIGALRADDVTLPPDSLPKEAETATSTEAGGNTPMVGPGFDLQAPARPCISHEQAEAAPLPETEPHLKDDSQAAGLSENRGSTDAAAPSSRPSSGKDGDVASRPKTAKFPQRALTKAGVEASTPEDSSACRIQRLAAIVEDPRFDVAVLVLIVLFIITMAFEVQYLGLGTGYDLQFEGYDAPESSVWPNAEAAFRVLEDCFVVIFTIELVLRVMAGPRRFFLAWLSYVDILCVVAGIYSWYAVGGAGGLMLVRFLRFLKVGRLVDGRVVNVFRVTGRTASTMQFLVKCIASSISTVAWGMIILVLLQCVMGIAFNQLVSQFMSDPGVSVTERKAVFQYYGTFTRAMITMFEVHLANWAPACRVLVDYVGEWAAYVFITYRCVVAFAILSVINAVFVQQSLRVAHHDRAIMLQQAEHEAHRYEAQLKHLFTTLDTSKDGQLSWAELSAVADDPVLKLWMSALEIDSKDLEHLFRLFDLNGDKTVSPDELFEGATKIKGHAKSIDILNLLSRVTTIDHKLNSLLDTPLAAKPSLG